MARAGGVEAAPGLPPLEEHGGRRGTEQGRPPAPSGGVSRDRRRERTTERPPDGSRRPSAGRRRASSVRSSTSHSVIAGTNGSAFSALSVRPCHTSSRVSTTGSPGGFTATVFDTEIMVSPPRRGAVPPARFHPHQARWTPYER